VNTVVTGWPSYLLKDVPDRLRHRVSIDAAAEYRSVSDVIRRILCARYGLDCPPMSRRYTEQPAIKPTILLRLQPALKGELFLEAEATECSVRSIILDTLTAHYNGKDH